MTNDNHRTDGKISTDQQAVEWMARDLSGAMLPDKAHQFEMWLKEPGNRDAYDQLAQAAAGADIYAEQLLAENFEQELNALARAQPTRPWVLPTLGTIAATFLVAVMAGLFVLSVQEPQTIRYATAIGDRKVIQLQDDTTMTLNTSTQVDVLYEATQRTVSLVGGEAFFEVSRDPDRRFAVTTAHGVIAVTGTSFNVRTTTQQTSVSVISGAVEVQLRGQEMATLLAGEAVTFDLRATSLDKVEFDATHVLSWRTGRISFEDTPLSDVIEELNRYFPVPFVLDENVTADAPVNGAFDVTDQLAVTRGLSVALSLNAVRRPEGIVLTTTEAED